MKKLASVAAAALILLAPASAAAFRVDAVYENAFTYGSTGTDSAWSSVIDNSGNFYIFGDFEGTVDFDPTDDTDEHTSNGDTDYYLTKYDQDGFYDYTRTWGNAEDDEAYGISIYDGDLFVIGEFEDTVDFDPGADTDDHSSNGDDDVFISKFNSDGDHIWTKTFGGINSDRGYRIAGDSNGNIYAVGYYSDTVDFDPEVGVDEHTSAGGDDGYITKFDADGTHQWVKLFEGLGDVFLEGVSADANDDIYVATTFNGATNFDSDGDETHDDNGGDDVALSKFNSDGDHIWTKTFGGALDDSVDNIKIDVQGNLYVVGTFQGTVDFDPNAGTVNRTSEGDDDAYLARFTGDGELVWVYKVGGDGEEDSNAIEIDDAGRVYWGGRYESDDVDFDTGGGEDIASSAFGFDGFMSIYTENGAYHDTIFIDGGGGDEEVYTVAAESSSARVFIGGGTESSIAEIGPVAGGEDAFILELSVTDFYHLTGVSDNLEITETDSGNDVLDQDEGGFEVDDGLGLTITKASDGSQLSQVQADLFEDGDWSGVDGDVDLDGGKSFITGLDDAEGVVGTHTLYVPKLDGDDMVAICPEATILAEVTLTCDNIETHTDDDSDTSIVTIDGHKYWKVTGLSGTGGISTTQAEIEAALLATTGVNANTYTLIAMGLITVPLALAIYSGRHLKGSSSLNL